MNIFITGRPGVGKSTLLKRLISPVPSHDRFGFYTEEVLQRGKRVGFDIVTSHEVRLCLARKDLHHGPFVKNYRVHKGHLDTLMTLLGGPREEQLLYIDEIGEMQLQSEEFPDLVKKFASAQNYFIATVSSVYRHSLIQELNFRGDSKWFTVTPDNRESLHAELAGYVAKITSGV